MLNSGIPKKPRAIGNIDGTGNELFSKFDALMKIKPKYKSTQSLQVIQVGICEKQTIFLINSGELYGCGASENGILGENI